MIPINENANSNNDIILTAKNISKIYTRGIEKVHAVNDISVDLRRGEFVAFMGPSGSGKTTLINILGCLDNPSSGELSIAGQSIFSENKILSEKQLTVVRREMFGYIFQKFYLIPTLTVIENIGLPLTFYHKKDAGNAIDLMKLLGIDHRANHFPGELSGGEMQRVAIARALINNPEILLADEPTGNLDTHRSQEIGLILRELNEKKGITIIMVTHNPELAKISDRKIHLSDGKIANTSTCMPSCV